MGGGFHFPQSRIPAIDQQFCLACQRCAARVLCRPKAIIQIDPGEPPAIDGARCLGCLACILACPSQAIRPRQ